MTTILVTGAAVRVGKDICLAMADAGWDVVIHYNRSEKAAQELAGIIAGKKRAVHLVQADLRDEASTAGIFKQLAAKHVQVDCLVNNASLFLKNGFTDLSRASFNDHMAVNCVAPLQLAKDFAAQYKGEDGNIINITDGLEGWSMSPAFLSYALSKRALADATAMLVRALAPRVRINAIAPGPVLEGVQDKADTFSKLRDVMPLKRTGSTQEICGAIRYIVSSPTFTGQTITLSGGMHTLPNWAI